MRQNWLLDLVKRATSYFSAQASASVLSLFSTEQLGCPWASGQNVSCWKPSLPSLLTAGSAEGSGYSFVPSRAAPPSSSVSLSSGSSSPPSRASYVLDSSGRFFLTTLVPPFHPSLANLAHHPVCSLQPLLFISIRYHLLFHSGRPPETVGLSATLLIALWALEPHVERAGT